MDKGNCLAILNLNKFGWHTVNRVNIPYIYRGTTKMVALRIILLLYHGFFYKFTQNLFDLFHLEAFTMSESERKLYEIINREHCNNKYGKHGFGPKEQLVIFSDAMHFHSFLLFIYHRVHLKKEIKHTKYGYLALDGQSTVVPYVKLHNTYHLPIAYLISDDSYYLERNSHFCHPFVDSVMRFLIKLQNCHKIDGRIRLISLDTIGRDFDAWKRVEEIWITTQNNIFINMEPTKRVSKLNVKNMKNV